MDEHLQNLEAVLGRLHDAGLHLNRDKCTFMQPKIEYLGHVIDEQGRHPTEEKIQAIQEAPTPKNLTELRSFLGIINYYSKFLPNLSTQLNPLHRLLVKNKKWFWGAEQDRAFQKAKEALQSNTLLVHFDPSKPIILACDASQYGIGAVLSHVLEDAYCLHIQDFESCRETLLTTREGRIGDSVRSEEVSQFFFWETLYYPV